MASPAVEALVGTTLGEKYTLRSVIGQGGMGAVYEAEHAITKRRVAVKVMDPGQGWSPSGVQRFLREARVMAAIGHPNVVEVLDAGVNLDGTLYTVLTLLEGQSVAARLREGGPMGPRE